MLKLADSNSKDTRSLIGMAKKNARSRTDLEIQRIKQTSQNETSAFAGVDSSHIWSRMLDSGENC